MFFFKKYIFTMFKASQIILSDWGSSFYNWVFGAQLDKNEVKHKVETPHYPHQVAKWTFHIEKSN